MSDDEDVSPQVSDSEGKQRGSAEHDGCRPFASVRPCGLPQASSLSLVTQTMLTKTLPATLSLMARLMLSSCRHAGRQTLRLCSRTGECTFLPQHVADWEAMQAVFDIICRLAIKRKSMLPKLYKVTEEDAVCLRKPFKSPHPTASGFSQVSLHTECTTAVFA